MSTRDPMYLANSCSCRIISQSARTTFFFYSVRYSLYVQEITESHTSSEAFIEALRRYHWAVESAQTILVWKSANKLSILTVRERNKYTGGLAIRVNPGHCLYCRTESGAGTLTRALPCCKNMSVDIPAGDLLDARTYLWPWQICE
jgi:hypothetical protein